MPNSFYPTPVETFTDEQIELLMGEIEEAGILDTELDSDFEPGSWGKAAYDRYWELYREEISRHPTTPTQLSALAAAVSRAVMEKLKFSMAPGTGYWTGPKIGQNYEIRLPVKFGGSSGPSRGGSEANEDDYPPPLHAASYVLS